MPFWIPGQDPRPQRLFDASPDPTAGNNNAALVDFYNRKLTELDIPQFQAMSQLERDKLAAQMAASASQLFFEEQKQRYIQKAGDQELGIKEAAQHLAEDTQRFTQTIQNSQLDLDTSLGRGNLALGASKQASDEALQRAGLGLQGFQQADQSTLARQQLAMQGLQQADQSKQATQGLGLQGVQSGENISLANRQLALQGAQQSSTEGMDALKLAASVQGGPSNEFTRQQVLHGLNANGLSRAVDAIAGKYDLPSFQAPQAQAEARSLATMARDLRDAGGQTTGGDLAMRVANDAAADSYRTGGRAALGFGQDALGNPLTGPAAQAAGFATDLQNNPTSRFAEASAQLGADQADNPYGSPTQNIALGIAGLNAPEAAPVADSDLFRGGGGAAVAAYNQLLGDSQKAGTPPPSEAQQLDILRNSFPGLSDAEALELHRANRDAFTSGVGVMPAARMELLANQIRQRTNLAQVNAPIGRAQGVGNAYGNVLRRDGVSGLPADDPRSLAMWQTVGGVDPNKAGAAAQAGRDAFLASGGAVPGGGAMTDLLARYTKERYPTFRTPTVGGVPGGAPLGQGPTQSGQPVVQRPLPAGAVTNFLGHGGGLSILLQPGAPGYEEQQAQIAGEGKITRSPEELRAAMAKMGANGGAGFGGAGGTLPAGTVAGVRRAGQYVDAPGEMVRYKYTDGADAAMARPLIMPRVA